MLNISHTSVTSHVEKKGLSALQMVEMKKSSMVLRKLMISAFSVVFVLLFIPWTQNIRSYGSVTTLKPDQRPQQLHSVIGGRIENWHVQEGDYVEKGDTIIQISEIKDAYFDSQLIERTELQLGFKKESVGTYSDKISAQKNQLIVLKTQRDLKLNQSRIKYQQATLKVEIDSAAYSAAEVNLQIAEYQYNRMDSLYKQGLKSLTDLEGRRLKYQQSMAYANEAKNKWLNSKNELISAKLEISNVQMKFETDYNKVLSDMYATMSSKLDTETNLSKLENQLSNYQYRNGLYFITAPQSGYITKTISSGIGETIKEGQEILTIMPDKYDLAVQIYIDPIDLPLVHKGNKVRIQFDGWPAIVFSGWPNVSHGTYGGEVYAIDQYLGENGKYRILVSPDREDYEWPKALRFGSGTSTMMLLNDVPIWYELWRQINGFPPDFYTADQNSTEKKK
jgi:multidrug resistance efflux pump